MAEGQGDQDAARRPRWLGSVRARTTAASTLVVAAAVVGAGIVVLGVLQRNLADSTSLQAEVTAQEVATQVTVGTAFTSLDLPDANNQPVQVVAADGSVLVASKKLRGAPAFAHFAPAPRQTIRPQPHDRDQQRAEDAPVPALGATVPRAQFHDVRLPLAYGRRTGRDFRVAAVFAVTPRGQYVTIYAGASLNTERRAMASAGNVMLIGLLPLLAVIALVTWLVTRRALRPVEAIRAELATIMNGDLSRRVPQPPSRDEVARLASTTNATLAALERSVKRQRRFIADASHELRSPIASLRVQLEVARVHSHLLEINGLIDDTLRLERLAADLLLLARLDAGEPPRMERLDLAALARQELAHRAADRVPVDMTIPDTPVMVTGSSAQLAHVLTNLVDNAQRHATTVVRFALDQTQRHVVLQVTDDGPGVPAADRERIFERFVRLDDARSRDEGGAGLGLAIVRDLVHRHGGRVDVGDAPGGGAHFTVTMAVAPV